MTATRRKAGQSTAYCARRGVVRKEGLLTDSFSFAPGADRTHNDVRILFDDPVRLALESAPEVSRMRSRRRLSLLLLCCCALPAAGGQQLPPDYRPDPRSVQRYGPAYRYPQ